MYVEGDKGTGRFITSLGVYVCGFIPTIDGCNSLYYKTNPTPPTPIIHEHKIVQNIIQPPNRVLVERDCDLGKIYK